MINLIALRQIAKDNTNDTYKSYYIRNILHDIKENA